MATSRYCGRFAPSPTGPLHEGSLVAALASWLDARAHNGMWLVRIEDIDPPRCPPGADHTILQQLASCHLLTDAPPVWQSQRQDIYAQSLAQLVGQGWAYPCGCTRKDIDTAWQALGIAHQRHQERPYPGICRHGLAGKPGRSWRFAGYRYTQDIGTQTPSTPHEGFHFQQKVLHWYDRRLGLQSQQPQSVSGDFILQRADGLYAYQLAVVVDDALQGITHVVRGEDLSDNTPRQLLLQHALGVRAPMYLHTPLVRMPDGEKLSKQHGAPAVDVSQPLRALNAAALHLGLPSTSPETTVADALAYWVEIWRSLYNTHRD